MLDKSPTDQIVYKAIYSKPLINLPWFDVFQVELTQIERFNTIKGNINCVTNILNRFLLMYNRCKIQTLYNCFVGDFSIGFTIYCFVGDLVCRRFIHKPFRSAAPILMIMPTEMCSVENSTLDILQDDLFRHHIRYSKHN